MSKIFARLLKLETITEASAATVQRSTNKKHTHAMKLVELINSILSRKRIDGGSYYVHFLLSDNWTAEKLGISTRQVKAAKQQLRELGVISPMPTMHRDGRWIDGIWAIDYTAIHEDFITYVKITTRRNVQTIAEIAPDCGAFTWGGESMSRVMPATGEIEKVEEVDKINTDWIPTSTFTRFTPAIKTPLEIEIDAIEAAEWLELASS